MRKISIMSLHEHVEINEIHHCQGNTPSKIQYFTFTPEYKVSVINRVIVALRRCKKITNFKLYFVFSRKLKIDKYLNPMNINLFGTLTTTQIDANLVKFIL